MPSIEPEPQAPRPEPEVPPEARALQAEMGRILVEAALASPPPTPDEQEIADRIIRYDRQQMVERMARGRASARRQREALRAYAQAQGHEVAEEMTEEAAAALGAWIRDTDTATFNNIGLRRIGAIWMAAWSAARRARTAGEAGHGR